MKDSFEEDPRIGSRGEVRFLADFVKSLLLSQELQKRLFGSESNEETNSRVISAMSNSLNTAANIIYRNLEVSTYDGATCYKALSVAL